MIQVHGVIASMVTNFDEHGVVDAAAVKGNVEFLINAGVHGVCVAGGTGEALALDAEDYERLISAAVEGAAGRALIVAGALPAEPRRILECCRVARSAGAQVAMVIPPYFVGLSDRQLKLHLGNQCCICCRIGPTSTAQRAMSL